MGKVNTILLSADMTFKEKKVKTQETNLEIDNKGSYTPSFTIGRSVFREVGISPLKFWRKSRNLILLLDGSAHAFELHDGKTKALEPSYWTRKEKRKIIAKIVAKSKAQQKVISTTHFIILAILLGIVLVLQFMSMRGIRLG